MKVKAISKIHILGLRGLGLVPITGQLMYDMVQNSIYILQKDRLSMCKRIDLDKT